MYFFQTKFNIFIGEQNQCNFYKTLLTLFFMALGSSSISHELILFTSPWGTPGAVCVTVTEMIERSQRSKLQRVSSGLPPPLLLSFRAPCLIDTFPRYIDTPIYQEIAKCSRVSHCILVHVKFKVWKALFDILDHVLNTSATFLQPVLARYQSTMT